jgi:hypothetical protein
VKVISIFKGIIADHTAKKAKLTEENAFFRCQNAKLTQQEFTPGNISEAGGFGSEHPRT